MGAGKESLEKMNRQTARSWRGGKHNANRDVTTRDREPSEDRASFLRWHRIWIGLGLIAIAIIWLAVNNALGLYATTPAPSATAPALGTAQSTGKYMFNAKLVGNFQQVAGGRRRQDNVSGDRDTGDQPGRAPDHRAAT